MMGKKKKDVKVLPSRDRTGLFGFTSGGPHCIWRSIYWQDERRIRGVHYIYIHTYIWWNARMNSFDRYSSILCLYVRKYHINCICVVRTFIYKVPIYVYVKYTGVNTRATDFLLWQVRLTNGLIFIMYTRIFPLFIIIIIVESYSIRTVYEQN